MTAREKLEVLFSEKDFFKVNADKGSFEEILAVVHERYPEITEEELNEFLEALCDVMHNMDHSELTDSDLENVAGGGITIMTLIIIGVAAYAGSKAGDVIGEAIYYYKDNKKKKKK